jgi:hypothetical protein
VDYRADLWNLRTTYKLKLPCLTDQAAATERQEKLERLPNYLEKL